MEMKKIIIGGLVLAVSAIGLKAFAHSRISQAEKVERITEKMSRKLSLTAQQKAQVYDINLQRAKGHQKAFEAGRDEEMVKDAVEAWKQSLKDLLTADQQRKIKI